MVEVPRNSASPAYGIFWLIVLGLGWAMYLGGLAASGLAIARSSNLAAVVAIALLLPGAVLLTIRSANGDWIWDSIWNDLTDDEG